MAEHITGVYSRLSLGAFFSCRLSSYIIDYIYFNYKLNF